MRMTGLMPCNVGQITSLAEPCIRLYWLHYVPNHSQRVTVTVGDLGLTRCKVPSYYTRFSEAMVRIKRSLVPNREISLEFQIVVKLT